MGALLGQQQAGSVQAGGTVDFIVDMFDRPNADTLGAYWSETSNFVLKNNHVLFNATGSSFSGRLQAAVSENIQQGEASFFTPVQQVSDFAWFPTASKISNFYTQSLSAPDATIKITFDIPQSPLVVVPSSLTLKAIQANWFAAGAAFGSKNSSSIAGISMGGIAIPAIDFFTLAVNTAAIVTGSAVFGDFKNFSTVLAAVADTTIPALSDAQVHNPFQLGDLEGTSAFNQVLALPGAAVGSNTLVLTASGSNYQATLNGAVLYSAALDIVSERSKVGLAGYGFSTLAMALTNATPFYGITSFKAWRSDQPEPPSESGHGILAGTRKYTDKYHTPIISNGQITGYTYTPTA